MPTTPRQAGRKARSGAAFPSEVLAENLRMYRALRRMSQEELGVRMRDLGHGWSNATAGEVERNTRNVTVDEQFGLALSLGVTIGQLFDPTGPDHTRRRALDLGLFSLPEGTAGDAVYEAIAPALAYLMVTSRVVVRLPPEGIEVDVAAEPPIAAQREFDRIRAEGPLHLAITDDDR